MTVGAGWRQFADAAPELAAFGAGILVRPPGVAYLATVAADGYPRVHPVTPFIGDGRLFVFMEPSSPKARDLHDRRMFALHNGVPDTNGSGGEFFVRGTASLVDDVETRAVAVIAAPYEPAERYVPFELHVVEARCNAYGDVTLPEVRHWRWQPTAGTTTSTTTG